MATSINQNQPEDNYQDLQGPEALEKIRTLTKKAGTCFFCTKMEAGRPFAARPMALQEVDDQGRLWFLSAGDSTVNQQLLELPFAQLLFQGSDYSDFLMLYGGTQISRDRQRIKELWNPMMKVWFTEGEDDPRITVISFDPTEGYYWDTKNNMAIGLIKRLAGAVTGQTLDDSIEGKILV